MINGNVKEFVDHMYYGDELIFIYHGKKFFLQGLTDDNGIHNLYLDQWDPIVDGYVWIGHGTIKEYPVEDFLNAELWDGRKFLDAESEMEWVDA